MKNGSLEQWFHPEILSAEPPTTLDLSHRLNIIIDVASALHYLDQECEQLVIHCDLKPSNVLLDEDMVAHVSDFGIARLVSTICGNTGIKGSVGYAPPEVAQDGIIENLIPTIKECLVSLFRIGIICSMESPKERMNIMDVTRELNIIRKTFLAGFRSHN
ncbi:unnamed protein product [Trifolium pratense]|uniref:Uncharacterized protein n=1 Tax=Trifolium pratense TaxID=57577 RepID=A0ACB0JRZ6_TRIPR|nr:unnamed protein product [Trifolium pratense]